MLKCIFTKADGELLEVKDFDDPDNNIHALIQFMVDIDMMFYDSNFETLIPEEFRKYFMVEYRDGTKHRYGRKQRYL